MKILRRRGEIGWSLWLCWVLVTVIGAITGWVLDPIFYDLLGGDVGLFSNTIVAGIVASHWLLLRWWFSRTVWWVLATLLGLALYGFGDLVLYEFSLYPSVIKLIVIVVIVVVLSLWQRRGVEQIVSHLVHRQRGGRTLLWSAVAAVTFAILAFTQIISLTVAGLLAYGFFDIESASFAAVVFLIGLGIPILLFGIITGTAFVWLLRLPRPERDALNQDFS